jgi:hypothetical protein
MSDKTISALTASTTPLAGTEVLPIVQSGVTKKVAVSDLTAGRDVSAQSLLTSKQQTEITLRDPTNYGSSPGVTPTGLSTKLTFEGDIASGFGSTTNVGEMAYFRLAYQDTAISNNTVQGRGRLYVGTSDGGGPQTPAADKFYFDYNGDLSLMTGNLVIGTAGKGIDFSADGQAAGMTSELLDDYEEGTWTPAFDATVSGAGTATTLTSATYVKIGKLVTVTAAIDLTTKDATASGNLIVTGLPFTSASDNRSSNAFGRLTGLGLAVVTPSVLINTNSTRIEFMGISTVGPNPLQNMSYSSYANNGLNAVFSICYLAA